MVKFSKQLEGQLVPEWKHAFVDYSLLKKDLKRVQHALLLGRCEAAAGLTAAAQAQQRQQTSGDRHAERAVASLSQWLQAAGLLGSSGTPRDHGVIHV
jgi:hypothetical protein